MNSVDLTQRERNRSSSDDSMVTLDLDLRNKFSRDIVAGWVMTAAEKPCIHVQSENSLISIETIEYTVASPCSKTESPNRNKLTRLCSLGSNQSGPRRRSSLQSQQLKGTDSVDAEGVLRGRLYPRRSSLDEYARKRSLSLMSKNNRLNQKRDSQKSNKFPTVVQRYFRKDSNEKDRRSTGTGSTDNSPKSSVSSRKSEACPPKLDVKEANVYVIVENNGEVDCVSWSNPEKKMSDGSSKKSSTISRKQSSDKKKRQSEVFDNYIVGPSMVVPQRKCRCSTNERSSSTSRKKTYERQSSAQKYNKKRSYSDPESSSQGVSGDQEIRREKHFSGSIVKKMSTEAAEKGIQVNSTDGPLIKETENEEDIQAIAKKLEDLLLQSRKSSSDDKTFIASLKAMNGLISNHLLLREDDGRPFSGRDSGVSSFRDSVTSSGGSNRLYEKIPSASFLGNESSLTANDANNNGTRLPRVPEEVKEPHSNNKTPVETSVKKPSILKKSFDDHTAKGNENDEKIKRKRSSVGFKFRNEVRSFSHEGENRALEDENYQQKILEQQVSKAFKDHSKNRSLSLEEKIIMDKVHENFEERKSKDNRALFGMKRLSGKSDDGASTVDQKLKRKRYKNSNTDVKEVTESKAKHVSSKKIDEKMRMSEWQFKKHQDKEPIRVELPRNDSLTCIMNTIKFIEHEIDGTNWQEIFFQKSPPRKKYNTVLNVSKSSEEFGSKLDLRPCDILSIKKCNSQTIEHMPLKLGKACEESDNILMKLKRKIRKCL